MKPAAQTATDAPDDRAFATEGTDMYTLFRNVSLRNLLSTQAPALMISLLIAELFYKFHSFTLECLAFLATWFVIDALATGVRGFWIQRGGSVPR